MSIDNGAWRIKSFSYLYILLSNILAQLRPIGQRTNGPILRWSNYMDHFQCENPQITTLRWLWRKLILVCMACGKKEKEWGTQVCERKHARMRARPMCSRMFEFPHPSPFYYLPCRLVLSWLILTFLLSLKEKNFKIPTPPFISLLNVCLKNICNLIYLHKNMSWFMCIEYLSQCLVVHSCQ